MCLYYLTITMFFYHEIIGTILSEAQSCYKPIPLPSGDCTTSLCFDKCLPQGSYSAYDAKCFNSTLCCCG